MNGSQSQPSTDQCRHQNRFAIAIIITLGVICYVNSFRNEFVWDDHSQIEQNRFLRSWVFMPRFFTSDVREGYGAPAGWVHFYRPLWMLSQLVDYQLWGPRPFGFHLTNLVLHIANGLLLFALSRALELRRDVSLLAAAMFVCHPVHTETTTYIAGRVAELSVLWMIVSLLFFLKYAADSPRDTRGRNWLLAGSAMAFALALLSKEIAVTLPGVLLAACVLLRSNRKLGRQREIWAAVVFGLVLIAYFAVRMMVLSVEVYPAEHPLIERIELAARALAACLALAIVPINLHIDRTVLVAGWQSVLLTTAGALALCVLIGLMIWFFHRDSRVTFGLAFFLIGFSINSNLVPLNITLAERWLYWPMVGLLVGMAAAVEWLTRGRPRAFRTTLTTGWIIVVVFAAATVAQNRVWRDDRVLFETAIARGANTARLWNNLGHYYLNLGDLAAARKNFEIAIQRKPPNPDALRGIGMCDATQTNYAAARLSFGRAIEAEPHEEQTSVWLAFLLEEMGEPALAEQTLRDAVAQERTALPAIKLANFYYRHDRLSEAEQLLRGELGTDPKHAVVHNSLGTVMFRQGKPTEAEEHFRLALRYDRWLVDAYANMAAVASQRGDVAGALRYYNQALRLAPRNADLYYTLGLMLRRHGRIEEARRALARVLELEPNHGDARQLLNSLEHLGNTSTDR